MPGDVIKTRTVRTVPMNSIVIKKNAIHGCSIAEMVVASIKHGNAMVTTTARTKRMRRIVMSQLQRICRMYRKLWFRRVTIGCLDAKMSVVCRIGGNAMV